MQLSSKWRGEKIRLSTPGKLSGLEVETEFIDVKHHTDVLQRGIQQNTLI